MALLQDIPVSHRYLNLPVNTKALTQWMTVRLKDTLVQQFEIKLAPESPEFFVYLDLAAHVGGCVTVEAQADEEELYRSLHFSDHIAGHEEMYEESLRPQFHFTSRRGWINDPIGLHRAGDTYHLFYQHNPYGVDWGNMHWGHAVSTDMVHWSDLGDVLFPDAQGTMWSGSGVVDVHNTSGLKSGEKPPQVLVYTAAGDTSPLSQGMPFTQCLAYSGDGGMTWTKYEKNPVVGQIRSNNRDPKVFWHKGSCRWVMALFLAHGVYALLSSPDLTHWEQMCDVAMSGCAECPDFFELPVDDNPGDTRWVFFAATRGAYRIGHFDGRVFSPESPVLYTVPEGAHSYAAQTWNLDVQQDARRIQMSWANATMPGMPFHGFLTFPCTLSLRTTTQGLRLFVYPIQEVERLYKSSRAYADVILDDAQVCFPASGLLDIHAVFALGSAKTLGLVIRGTPVVYQVAEKRLTCRNVTCDLESEDGRIVLRALVDQVSLEIFGNEGLAYMPLGLVYETQDGFCAFAQGGRAELLSLEVRELGGIWRE